MFNKTLIYVAFFVTLGLTSLPLYANDSEVPSEKIQQFVDVYKKIKDQYVDDVCLLYTSPSPRDLSTSRMPSSA